MRLLSLGQTRISPYVCSQKERYKLATESSLSRENIPDAHSKLRNCSKFKRKKPYAGTDYACQSSALRCASRGRLAALVGNETGRSRFP